MSDPMSADELYDPDPWILVTLALTAVGTFAQLASLAIQVEQTQTVTVPIKEQHRVAVARLTDEIEEAVLLVERMVRFFSEVADGSDSPLRAPFAFGASRLNVTRHNLDRYKGLASGISLKTSAITQWTLTLIQQDALFARDIGKRILNSFNHIQDDINDLLIQRPPNEIVLERLLNMLREFRRILGEIQGRQN